MFYGKIGFDFFPTSGLLSPNTKTRPQLMRASPRFYSISDNPNLGILIIECSPYTQRFDLEDEYHKKRMDIFAFISTKINY